jgi:DNA-directed RNA polymerase specialized sigma24 family protein
METDMYFAEMPSIRLTSDQKTHALSLLNKANNLLKKWSQHFPDMKFRQVRNAIFEKPESLAVKVQDELKAEFASDVAIIAKVRQSDPVLNGKSIEDAILQNYSFLAKKHALKWSRQNKNIIALEDFLQECYMQIIESMYNWNSSGGADITTYIWWSLKNRLSNMVNQQASNLSHFTNSGINLLIRYNKIKETLPLHHGIDDIAEVMNLSDDEKSHLLDMLIKVHFQENGKSRNENKQEYDYTSETSVSQSSSDSHHVEENEWVEYVLSQSNLTPFERELIEKSMNPYYGWQIEIGKNRISPRTGKPYGRVRIGQILEKARNKVALAYKRLSGSQQGVS